MRAFAALSAAGAVTVLTPIVLVALLFGCETREPVRPYIVPVDAAKNEIMTWTKDNVYACFGAPKDSDTVAGWHRYYFQRDRCAEWIIFKDDKVHSVEGYGSEQECWWAIESCAM